MIVEFKDLLSVADIINSSVKEYQGERYYLTTGNLSENGNVKLEKYSYKDKPSRANQNVKTNDIIVARMKNTNKVLRIKEDLQDIIVSTGFVVLRAKNEVIEPSYLELVLKSKMFQNQKDKYCKGATQKAINNKELSKIKIPILDKTSQSKLVNLCKKVTTLIQKRKAQIEALDQLTQSVFLEMFGDPKNNPNHFVLTNMDEIATKITDGEHKTPKRVDKGIKLLSARNIKNNYIDYNAGLDYVPQEEYERIKKRCNPEFDDIFISCSGTIGRVTRVNTREPLALVRSVALIKLKKEVINPYYIETYLQTPYIQQVMKKSSNQSSQANLFNNQIRKIPVVLPPIHLQEKFAEIKLSINNKRKKMQHGLLLLEENFNSLMQRAFKGELFIEEKVSNL